MKIIDLSKTIEYSKNDPKFMRIRIKNSAHKQSKWIICLLGLPFKLFPEKFMGWANDSVKNMGVHSTTHLDAPWHYDPFCNGLPAKTIDQVPLEWCYGEGLVIDMKHKNDFEAITKEDVIIFLQNNSLRLKPEMIVLIKTGRDKYIGTKEYPYKGTGMSAEATEWLIDQGIRVMGIDQWGWDLPLHYQIEKSKKEMNRTIFWEAHLVGKRKEYCHIEQLVNLDALPYSGFKVALFPLKIKGASAAPARVVAIFD